MTHSPFPRPRDDLTPAWGLLGDEPATIWERFSPLYEAQAERLWKELAALSLEPALEWAGSQDGEAIIGRDTDGEIIVLFHLEDPKEAQMLEKAIDGGELMATIIRTIRETAYEAGLHAAGNAQS